MAFTTIKAKLDAEESALKGQLSGASAYKTYLLNQALAKLAKMRQQQGETDAEYTLRINLVGQTAEPGLWSTTFWPEIYTNIKTDTGVQVSNVQAAAQSTQSSLLSDSVPLIDGAAAAGTSSSASRGDHKHPTDTTRAPVASPTFTGTVTLPADPTVNLGAATKQYVDGLFNTHDHKMSVRVATTGALPANSVVSGVMTATANGLLTAIDTTSVSAGNRILVKNEATGANNGIYTITTIGSLSAKWVLTRAADADGTNELNSGSLIYVEEGTTLAKTYWTLTNSGTVTIGTTSLTFEQSAVSKALLDGKSDTSHTHAFKTKTSTIHVSDTTRAITEADNGAEIHLEGTGNLTIAASAITSDTFGIRVVNTDAGADRTLTPSGFDGVYLRNGDDTDTITALTIKSDEAYEITVTNNTGSKYLNIFNVSGGGGAVESIKISRTSAKIVDTNTTYAPTTASSLVSDAHLGDVTNIAASMDGGYMDDYANAVIGPITKTATTWTFWIGVMETTMTKAVQIELSQVNNGISWRAIQAKYADSDQTSTLGYFDASGTAGTVATSATANGYGVYNFRCNVGSNTVSTLAKAGLAITATPKRAIPVFTANTTNGYIVSAVSEYSATYAAWKALQGGVSGDWASASATSDLWLKVQLPVPKIVTRIVVAARSAVNKGPLTGWKFQGSNDNTNWTDLYTSSVAMAQALTTIDIENTTPYLYYRMFSATVSTPDPGMAAFWLYEDEFSFSDVTPAILNTEYLSPEQHGGIYGTVYRQYFNGSLPSSLTSGNAVAMLIDYSVRYATASNRGVARGWSSDGTSGVTILLSGISGNGNLSLSLTGTITTAYTSWVDYTKV